MGVLAEAVIEQRYDVEHRLSLEVDALDEHQALQWTSISVNEVSVEKAARERMVEVLVKINGIALSRWGCDGVLVASPTGSTAYAFSAGGPLVWPDVDALLVVPLSAHALFASPVVVGAGAEVNVELVAAAGDEAVVWCDGRRSTGLRSGWSVRVRRHRDDLLLARLSEQPFTERLVRKFGLRVEGWRGQAEKRES
ncbi:glutamine synthetase-like [Platysternon megacephalum]|uniref:Glutamine synthetase-like n=1 Tax=Platysternon megacephalum TaxID=55544 RepID=A0A4D9DG78_9SAUR|nr:glutamine synthetase-like [Platysternon megacephalum]